MLVDRRQQRPNLNWPENIDGARDRNPDSVFALPRMKSEQLHSIKDATRSLFLPTLCIPTLDSPTFAVAYPSALGANPPSESL